MVDEEGIRLVWYASTHHGSSAKPFGLQDVWLSLRGVHLTLLRTKRSISLRCAPVQCVDQTQMWLCGFLRLYHISWLLSKLCGSQLQHEAVLKDWSSVFPDMFLHLGSDEVPGNCWNNSKDLAWMILCQRWWAWSGLSNPSEIKLGEGGMRPDERLIWKLRMAVVKKTTPGF